MQHRNQTGLTLTELLIVIALLAVTAQFALPAWQEFIAKNRSQALMHRVKSAVRQTRQLAVTRRTSMELCGSANQAECDNRWQQGWLIRPANQSDAPPVQVNTLTPSQLQLQWAGFRQRIVFHSSGIASSSNGRFYLCRNQQIDWQLILNRQGRLRHASTQENRQEDYRCH